MMFNRAEELQKRIEEVFRWFARKIGIHFFLALLGVSIFVLGCGGLLVYIMKYKDWMYVLMSKQDLQILMNPFQHLLIGCCLVMGVALSMLFERKEVN